MQDLKNFNLQELEKIIEEEGFEKFRAKQIFDWIYKKRTLNIDDIKNIPENLKIELKQKYTLSSLIIIKIQKSKDGTKKILFELSDKNKIESVIIPDGERRTLCVSSQAGCGCACVFCATGKLGFKRNLQVCEIIEEFLRAYNIEKIDNIVFMGMGEPFLNWENVKKTIEILSDKNGLNFSQSRITVSTIGIVPVIKKIADENCKFYLAISLVAGNDILRNKLVPFNKKYTLKEIIEISKYYNKKTGKEITYEYVLLDGINDSENDAKDVANILKGVNCKINLIPYNGKKNSEFKRPAENKILQFQKVLMNSGYKTFIRKEKGSDISAACGQLAGE